MLKRSGTVITRDLTQAFDLANEYAAEHLCLLLEDPWSWLGQVRNAGGIFLGEHSYEVLGDYVAGPSHVMPTGGTARFASPLNLLSFVKVTSLIALDEGAARQLSAPAQIIAQSRVVGRACGSGQAAGVAMSEKVRIRRDIESMSAYTPTTSLEVFAERLGLAPGELIKLDANENPFGPSPRVIEALAELQNMHVYPDPESGRLRELSWPTTAASRPSRSSAAPALTN